MPEEPNEKLYQGAAIAPPRRVAETPFGYAELDVTTNFSFLRGVVTIGMFAALGVIVASIAFGFTLGLVFTGLLIGLLALKILYDTSLMLNYFPPSQYVSAALMLFGTVATLFWNIMVFLMRMRSD